jgi:hypothetical protein
MEISRIARQSPPDAKAKNRRDGSIITDQSFEPRRYEERNDLADEYSDQRENGRLGVSPNY